MRILGISLGHDSNFALVEDGKITGVMEAERYFRQKRYKLSAETLEPGKRPSTYQYTDIEDLKMFLNLVKKEWGARFDSVAVQNQGRKQEFGNLLILLKEMCFEWSDSHHVNHHLSHAALSYFTSSFSEALVLSFDGIGNDGKTVFFSARGNKLEYAANIPIAFGQNYNNMGYTIGIKPEIDGTTSGKAMGLASYGTVRENWLPYAREYIHKYMKLPTDKVDGLAKYGLGRQINSVGLEKIPELSKYLVERKYAPGSLSWKNRLKFALGVISRKHLLLPGPTDKDSQDLAATVQHAW